MPWPWSNKKREQKEAEDVKATIATAAVKAQSQVLAAELRTVADKLNRLRGEDVTVRETGGVPMPQGAKPA